MTENLTSGNLPHASFSNAETRRRSSDVHCDPTVKHKEHHLHFSGVLDPFGTPRR